MGNATEALMKLRPVTFYYKHESDNGLRTLQYGLIAEEVARIFPELVAYNPDGSPYTVRYQFLSSMLLNEVQKQYQPIAGRSRNPPRSRTKDQRAAGEDQPAEGETLAHREDPFLRRVNGEGRSGNAQGD